MDKNSEIVKLNDELLDQVSGGEFLLPWRNPDDELGQEVVDQKQPRWDPKLPWALTN